GQGTLKGRGALPWVARMKANDFPATAVRGDDPLPQTPMRFDRDNIKKAVVDLAKKGVFIGTSSWKYPGWRGMLYDDARYVWRGRFSKSRFDRFCLAEYAEVFRTVSVDAAYYKFPDARFWEELVAPVPPHFFFSLKV